MKEKKVKIFLDYSEDFFLVELDPKLELSIYLIPQDEKFRRHK